jgi:hypothetical protein
MSGASVKLTNQRYVTALYAMTDSGAFRSMDGGVIWQKLPSVGYPLHQDDSCWPSPDVGFIVCSSGTAGVYRTLNGGDSWSLVLAGTYYAIDMLSESDGWVCGGAVIKRTHDGGGTWTDCTIPAVGTAQLFDIAVAPTSDGAVGVCVGGDVGGGVAAVLTLSLSGGVETWTLRTTGVAVSALNSCALWRGRQSTGLYMVAATLDPEWILYSVNSGASWANNSSGLVCGSPVGIDFTGPRSIVMVASDTGGMANVVFRSKDGGATYAADGTWPASYIAGAGLATLHADQRRVWAFYSDPDAIHSSMDGGSTQRQVISPGAIHRLAAVSGYVSAGPSLILDVQ